MTFSGAMPLFEARSKLRELVDDGHECPCCRQFAKVYRRRIHASMAAGLIAFYRAYDLAWGYVPDVLPTDRLSADFPKLRYWRLIEEELEERDDGSSRTGRWRVLPYGAAFVAGRVSVPKYARVYDGRCLGLVGDPVTIRDALGKRFDYAELMAA